MWTYFWWCLIPSLLFPCFDICSDITKIHNFRHGGKVPDLRPYNPLGPLGKSWDSWGPPGKILWDSRKSLGHPRPLPTSETPQDPQNHLRTQESPWDYQFSSGCDAWKRFLGNDNFNNKKFFISKSSVLGQNRNTKFLVKIKKLQPNTQLINTLKINTGINSKDSNFPLCCDDLFNSRQKT